MYNNFRNLSFLSFPTHKMPFPPPNITVFNVILHLIHKIQLPESWMTKIIAIQIHFERSWITGFLIHDHKDNSENQSCINSDITSHVFLSKSNLTFILLSVWLSMSATQNKIDGFFCSCIYVEKSWTRCHFSIFCVYEARRSCKFSIWS